MITRTITRTHHDEVCAAYQKTIKDANDELAAERGRHTVLEACVRGLEDTNKRLAERVAGLEHMLTSKAESFDRIAADYRRQITEANARTLSATADYHKLAAAVVGDENATEHRIDRALVLARAHASVCAAVAKGRVDGVVRMLAEAVESWCAYTPTPAASASSSSHATATATLARVAPILFAWREVIAPALRKGQPIGAPTANKAAVDAALAVTDPPTNPNGLGCVPCP